MFFPKKKKKLKLTLVLNTCVHVIHYKYSHNCSVSSLLLKREFGRKDNIQFIIRKKEFEFFSHNSRLHIHLLAAVVVYQKVVRLKLDARILPAFCFGHTNVHSGTHFQAKCSDRMHGMGMQYCSTQNAPRLSD